MHRRTLLKSMATFSAGALIFNSPFKAIANAQPQSEQIVNYKDLFNKALSNNADLIGFNNSGSSKHNYVIPAKKVLDNFKVVL